MNVLINHSVKLRDLGLIDYQQAWDYQEALLRDTIAIKVDNRKNDLQQPTPNHLILCEHPHVYTLGKSGDPANLLLDDAGLERVSATYYKINRGGDITYHGPGQLVGYPILDLENFFTDIHKYLRLIEEAIILVLKDYDLDAGRIEGLTGVWLDYAVPAQARKICAIGVRTSRWVTMHGFAFNLNTDLGYFSHIVPCGIKDKDVTSLHKEVGHEIDISQVKERFQHHFARLFDAHFD